MSFHIPDNVLLNSRTYYSSGSTNWQIWNKPKNINKVHFFCIGGGGAGGGGEQSGSNAVDGGGGGAGSTILQAVYQSFLLPDILYVRVGSGGIGSAISGTEGGISYVSVYPNILSSNLVAISGTSAGGGIGRAGGIIGTQASPSIAAFLSMSEFTTFPGIAGTAGSSSGTTPSNIIGLTNSILTGGAGGGGSTLAGTQTAGGNILANGLSPLISGGSIVSGGSSRPGGNGITYNIPFFSTGGAGGGGSYGAAASIGGEGGRGGIGSGGGGGGGGGGTAGIGGNGGNGIIIIYCT